MRILLFARSLGAPLAGVLLLLSGCPSSTPSATATGGDAAPSPPASATMGAQPDVPIPWMNQAPSTTASAAEPPAREIVGAAHILVAYKGALGAAKTVTRSKEEAKKRAEDALQKLKASKATFEQLVTDVSDDTASKPAHGALGNFERNVMPQSFSDATFNLPVGGTTDVVIETPRGFHIIRRTK